MRETETGVPPMVSNPSFANLENYRSKDYTDLTVIEDRETSLTTQHISHAQNLKIFFVILFGRARGGRVGQITSSVGIQYKVRM